MPRAAVTRSTCSGQNEVVRACVEKAREEHPELRIAGYRNGYFRRDNEEDVVAAVRAAKPDILFLGFGTPAEGILHAPSLSRTRRAVRDGCWWLLRRLRGLGGTRPEVGATRGSRVGFRLAQEPRRMWKRTSSATRRFAWLLARGAA